MKGIKALKFDWLIGELMLKTHKLSDESFVRFGNANILEELCERKHKTKEQMLIEIYGFTKSKYFKEEYQKLQKRE